MEQECTQQELSVSSDPVLEVELQSPMDEHWVVMCLDLNAC